jgi:hypothetical protein
VSATTPASEPPPKPGPRTRATPLRFVAHGRQIHDNERLDHEREFATAYDPSDAVLIAIALNTGDVIRAHERDIHQQRITDLQTEQARQIGALTDECARLRAIIEGQPQ